MIPTLEISEYFLQALNLYNNFTNTMLEDSNKLTNNESFNHAQENDKLQNEKNTILNQEELLEYLHNSKLDSFILYNSVYQKNKTLFNQEEYVKCFNYFKSELDSQIDNIENIILGSQLKLSEIYCTSLLEEKISLTTKKLEVADLESVEDFIKIIKELFEDYAKESRGRMKMNVFVKVMEKNWADLVDIYTRKSQDRYNSNVNFFLEEIHKENNQIKHLENEMANIDQLFQIKSKDLQTKKGEIEICNRELEYIQKEIELLEQEIEMRSNQDSNTLAQNS